MKKICFITTSRADFGTLNELIKEIVRKNSFSTQLIISGNHFSNIFGNTKKEIINKKNCLVKKVKVLSYNKNAQSVAISFSDCVNKFSKMLYKLKPNLFVVFGDRYEMLAAAISAYILRIPIIHIAGGEKTIGSIDDGFRHSISKLSNLHFPVERIYKNRLIQLGENPNTIFNFGSLNFSKIKNNNYLTKAQLEKKHNLKFYKKNLIITYHPDTVDDKKCLKNLSIVLHSLKKIKNTMMIITSPNADAQGVTMINYIKKYIKKNKLRNFLFFKSLGSQTYLSLLKFVDGVVGNSSSGLTEAPTFKIGTINIGDRQKGRLKAKSVIDCEPTKESINESINTLYSKDFQNILSKIDSPYGKGNATEKIMNVLRDSPIPKELKKEFYNL